VSSDFYKKFEDKHRGSRELIKSRLKNYLPFIQPLKEHYSNSQAIDLGCGRGEWLELLNEIGGFDAHGVDLDATMLEVCEAHKLKFQQQDALACLKSLEDESQTIVTGFHLAEHIPFEDLQELVKQAFRVLKPAGLLILETPNPENLVVGTVDFYMDPTHKQPIPPYLLAFIPDYTGFQQTKIVRLQEDKTLIHNGELTLLDVLRGVSPDYAVIAQKNAGGALMDKFNKLFTQDYGITLEFITGNFDRQEKEKANRVEQRFVAIEATLQQAEARVKQVEAKTQQAEARAQQAEQQMQQLLNSKSWQYTKPLRCCLSLIKRTLNKARHKD